MKSLCLSLVLLVLTYSTTNVKSNEQIKLQSQDQQQKQEQSFIQSQIEANLEETYDDDEEEGDSEKDEYDIIDQHQLRNQYLGDQQELDDQTDLITQKDLDWTEVEDEEKKDHYASEYFEARLHEHEGQADIRREEETLLRLVTKSLLLLLDMNITANDAVEEVEHYVDLHWNEDYDDAGEDCARYGGEMGGNVYYVFLNLDIDEFEIMTMKNRFILDSFKIGMDIFYTDLAEEEAEEDELENQNYFFFLQDDSGMKYADAYDHYEDNATEKLNDLLVEGFQLIQETDPNCNDVFYAADDLIDEIWDEQIDEAAESMFTEDRGRTNWIFMQMVKLDIDEVAFLSSYNQILLQALQEELSDLYKEVEADKYDDFDQDDDFLFTQLRTKSDKENAEKLAHKVLETLDKIEVADSTSNIDCYEIDDYIDNKYDDYEDAAESIINYSYKKSADIFISLNNLDIDECSFLTIEAMDVMNDLYEEMMDVYAEFSDAYAE